MITRDDLYSTQEALETLKIHRTELSKLVREKKISRVKQRSNKCFSFYLKKEIDNLLHNQEEFYIDVHKED